MKKIIAVVCHQVTKPLIHTVTYLSTYNENTIIIHVDKKSNFEDFEFLNLPNVIFIEDRVDVRWGTVTQINATLKLMECANTYQYDYFFLISGDDIPAMSNARINELLSSHDGEEFIHYQDQRNSYVDPVLRVKYLYPAVFFNRDSSLANSLLRNLFKLTKDFFYLNKKYIKNKNNLPKVYKSTNWFTLTKPSVEFIIEYLMNNPSFISLFDKSLCADEVFFHTILKLNKSIKIYENIYSMNNALRYIDWVSGPQYPKVLTENDSDKIIRSNCFFARKIDADADDEFMNTLIMKQ